jgi:hypothetical protein
MKSLAVDWLRQLIETTTIQSVDFFAPREGLGRDEIMQKTNISAPFRIHFHDAGILQSPRSSPSDLCVPIDSKPHMRRIPAHRRCLKEP